MSSTQKWRSIVLALATALPAAGAYAEPIRLDRDPTAAIAKMIHAAEGAAEVEVDPPVVDHGVRHGVTLVGDAHGDTDESGDEGPSHPQATHIVGVKLLALQAWVDDDGWSPETAVGLGVFYEFAVIPQWLEFEVSVGMMRLVSGNDRGTLTIVDPIFKVPFHPNDILEPYVGVGPAFTFARVDGESEFEAGASGVIGMYVWAWGDSGIDVEVSYTALINAGRVDAHELAFGFGYVYHF